MELKLPSVQGRSYGLNVNFRRVDTFLPEFHKIFTKLQKYYYRALSTLSFLKLLRQLKIFSIDFKMWA